MFRILYIQCAYIDFWNNAPYYAVVIFEKGFFVTFDFGLLSNFTLNFKPFNDHKVGSEFFYENHLGMQWLIK